MSIVIEINNLTKYYGTHLGIKDLNLIIKSGEVFGFLGPNGAGKSTTIRLILNLLQPTSGSVKIFGKDVRKYYSEIFKKLSNVPGELKLYEELSGYHFLNYINSFSAKSPELQKELFDAFQLKPYDLNKKIKNYSHGMKQKIAIIQAMQEKPDLLIMDEPSEGLDPINKNVLYDYVAKFKEWGKTVFFSSHYLAEVEKVCDRVGIVKQGKLIAEESIASLKKKMVRKLEVTFLESYTPQEFNLDNIQIVKEESNRLVMNVYGDINSVVRAISKYKLQNLVFPEPTLEDTFMAFYNRENESK
ncbi:ABC transporter ATP-binding protein [Calditrichota bacterium]